VKKTTGATTSGLAYEITHAEDWSGTASVTWAEPHKPRITVELPAEILRSCGTSAALGQAIAILTTLSTREDPAAPESVSEDTPARKVKRS
jgi:hypothetical protein